MSFPERLVVVHGYTASPAKHWFPWLAAEAEQAGAEAVVVPLPDSDHPDVRAWGDAVAAAAESLGGASEGLWIVGHSLGAITALRWVASLSAGSRIGGVVLVAGTIEPVPTLPALDDYLAAGLSDAEVARIREVAGEIRAIHSDDDATVPPEFSERMETRLGASTQVVPGAGHFVDREGWTELPAVLVALSA
ncbi:RBBP9/YdeN family alpha/beta hydrolase [Homoserinibacter sp. YIM 151385]|uniref:RBBP9/YdeN family alpha/beta hydrolase n=1 Tax=Homoserinibacter sp. YIM 151385 TaxID=2985506 RepID=UPI0022F0A135|nr:alpha/beta fold hydrolase [Homoserinibacter sp. YIM 151385]WBU37170.1 alpha/beta hydrolase [Homoserinibacter sp. YIM 151385]